MRKRFLLIAISFFILCSLVISFKLISISMGSKHQVHSALKNPLPKKVEVSEMPSSAVTNESPVQRFAGSDRYQTSALLCEHSWRSTSDNIILTTGESYPDSLCAAPLARKLDAPILLTDKDSLNDYTKKEITRLKPKNIFIIGGTGVISQNIENQLMSMSKNITRIGGADRYETSIMIAKLLDRSDEIFVATGEDFPDALSVASVAAIEGSPIILVQKNSISSDFNDYLKSNKISKSYMIGGPTVISDNVLSQIPNCTRIYGDNRYETNAETINTFSGLFDLKNTVFIATGDNFPDALSCSSVAGMDSSPIILTSKVADSSTSNMIGYVNSMAKNIEVLGGESVVPSSVINNFSSEANAKNYIKTPTYDGSNQACHPKVLYFSNGWNGWKYWMVMTPYPNTDEYFENPSILVSNNGTAWQVPKGLVNPIAPAYYKFGRYNSDPHLVYNDDTKELELWYRETIASKQDTIYRMTTKDGIHWSSPRTLLTFYNANQCFSPAIIYEDDSNLASLDEGIIGTANKDEGKKYRMWYINEKYQCMYTESKDAVKWSTPVEVKLNLPDSYLPWHIDVVHTDKGYEAVFCAFKGDDFNSMILFSNLSGDGLNFNSAQVILRPSEDQNGWDNKIIYRSTFVKVDGTYKLYYSGSDKNKKWHIGLSMGYSLDNLHGY